MRSVAAASVEIATELAVRQDPRARIGKLLVDAQLELAARQVPRARQVAAVERFFLAHVEQHEIVSAALDPRRDLRPCDMNATSRDASAISCATVLPPEQFVRSASVR